MDEWEESNVFVRTNNPPSRATEVVPNFHESTPNNNKRYNQYPGNNNNFRTNKRFFSRSRSSFASDDHLPLFASEGNYFSDLKISTLHIGII